MYATLDWHGPHVHTTHTYIHKHAHTYTRTHTTRIRTRTHTNSCTCTHTHAHTHTRGDMHIALTEKSTNMHAYTSFLHTHTYCMHTHTHMHTNMHTRTCTHVLPRYDPVVAAAAAAACAATVASQAARSAATIGRRSVPSGYAPHQHSCVKQRQFLVGCSGRGWVCSSRDWQRVVSRTLPSRRNPREVSQVCGALRTQSLMYSARVVDHHCEDGCCVYTSRAAMQSHRKRPTVRTCDGLLTHSIRTHTCNKLPKDEKLKSRSCSERRVRTRIHSYNGHSMHTW
jgi:hypothetical protein